MSKARRHTSPILKRLLSQIPEEELELTADRLRLNQKINNALKRSGLGKGEFAQRMGVEPPQVSKWLKGEQSYSSDTLLKMGRVLRESFIDLEERKERKEEVVYKKSFEWDREVEVQGQFMGFVVLGFETTQSAVYIQSIRNKHLQLQLAE